MLRTIGWVAIGGLVAGPGLAAEWPLPDTPRLAAVLERVRVDVPAPDWIGRARHDERRDGTENLTARWFVPVGLDAEADRLVVAVTDPEHWNLGLIGYLTDEFFRSCESGRQVDLELPADSPDYMLTYALCGYNYGTGSGAMLIGLSRDALAPDLLLDLWYETPMAPFDVTDEANWPMSAAEFEARLRALDAAVTVTPLAP